MLAGSAQFDGRHDLEAGPFQNGTQRLDGSPTLAEKDIERKSGGTRAYQYGFFPFVQGKGQPARTLSYQAIDDTVEYDFQLPGHVTPVTGGSYYQHIAVVDGGEYLLGSSGNTHRRVLRQVIQPVQGFT